VKQNSQALQASGAGGVLLPDTRIRRLTEVECERLQGFPDGWTEGISSTQRYKCLGNAVTVNVVEAIVEAMG
jgi:site-specific DNA-cytosine methylase